MAATSLALPNGNRGHAHSGSDGAIELKKLGYRSPLPEIKTE